MWVDIIRQNFACARNQVSNLSRAACGADSKISKIFAAQHGLWPISHSKLFFQLGSPANNVTAIFPYKFLGTIIIYPQSWV